MVRDVVTNLHGYSINDLLNTDIDALRAVLLSSPKQTKETGRLIDWIKERQEGGK